MTHMEPLIPAFDDPNWCEHISWFIESLHWWSISIE